MKPDELNIVIASPEGTVFKGKASSIIVPGAKGRFTVLPQHAPIISLLGKGTIACVPVGGDEQNYEIKGGFIEVKANEVSICIE